MIVTNIKSLRILQKKYGQRRGSLAKTQPNTNNVQETAQDEPSKQQDDAATKVEEGDNQ